MFLINSRSHLVFVTSPSSRREVLHQKRRTFSRSYGANLPSSFTQVLSSALVFSTCPPVSVLGTVLQHLKFRDFSWKRGINHFPHSRRNKFRIRVSTLSVRIYLNALPTCLNRHNHRAADLAFSVLPSQYCKVQEY